MKRLLILVFAFFIVFEANVATLGKSGERKRRVERVKFSKTYSLIREYEGNYVNDPKDKGGETYGGIARNFNPDWYGWRYIDQEKRRQNEKVNRAEFWVQDWYLDVWVKEGWGRLTNQQVANYLFEFRIHSPIGVRLIQKSLRECGFGIVVDNIMGEGTINSIRLCDPEMLLDSVQKRRIKFYEAIVRRDQTQKGFLHHWLKRAGNI